MGIINLKDNNSDLGFEYLLNAVAGYSQIPNKLNSEFLDTYNFTLE